MNHPVVKIGTALAFAVAIVVFFLPPPEGYAPQTMHADSILWLVENVKFERAIRQLVNRV